MYDVFLSHGHEDSEEVERLAAHLEDDYGFSIWLDRWILIPGEPWVQKIEKGFAQAKSCAVCLGARTPDGWFRDEVDLALDRQNKDPSFRVIPTILASGSRELVAGFLKLHATGPISQRTAPGRSTSLPVASAVSHPGGGQQSLAVLQRRGSALPSLTLLATFCSLRFDSRHNGESCSSGSRRWKIVMSEQKHPRLFLSVTSDTKDAAGWAYDYLRAAGFRVWLDSESLVPGENWRRAIERAYCGC